MSNTLKNCLKIIIIIISLYLSNHELYSTYASLKADMSIGLNNFVTRMLVIWPISIASVFIIAFNRGKYIRIFGGVLLGTSTLISDCFYTFYGYTINISDFKYLISIYDNILLPGVSFHIIANCKYQIIIALLLASAIILKPHRPIFKSTLWLLPASVPVLVLSYFTQYNITAGDALPSQFWVPSIAIASLQLEAKYPQDSTPAIKPEGKSATEHVLFIMDESIRSDFANSADITPFLSQLPYKYNYGWTTAANNTSMGSNLIVRYGLSKSDISHLNFLTKPSVWSYAKAAGYSTTYIDCQNNRSLQNHMNIYELANIDNFIQLNSNDIANKDMEAIPVLQRILSSPSKQFIYINKSGAHIPYRNKYPKNKSFFKTSNKNNDIRKEAYNYYANAVHWSVDIFFKNLLPGLDLSKTTIIYTSDHGQNILDDGTNITHTRREHANWQEVLVPLFVFTTNEALITKLKAGISHNINSVSSLSLFPTILYLFGYNLLDIHNKYGRTIFEKNLLDNSFFPGSIIRIYQNDSPWKKTPWPTKAPIITFKVIDNEVVPN